MINTHIILNTSCMVSTFVKKKKLHWKLTRMCSSSSEVGHSRWRWSLCKYSQINQTSWQSTCVISLWTKTIENQQNNSFIQCDYGHLWRLTRTWHPFLYTLNTQQLTNTWSKTHLESNQQLRHQEQSWKNRRLWLKCLPLSIDRV